MAMSATVFRSIGERSLQRASVVAALRMAPAATAGTARSLHVGEPRSGADKSYKFVVCGAGPGGLAVASSLGRRFGNKSVAVIEPADVSEAVYEPAVRYENAVQLSINHNYSPFHLTIKKVAGTLMLLDHNVFNL